MVLYRYIGQGVTNRNGVASINYTGIGRGKMEVVASTDRPVIDGSLQSEIYELLDCIFYDNGTLSDNNDWYDKNLSTSIFERLTDYTQLSFSSSKNRFQLTDNLTNDHLIFEFKIYNSSLTDDYVMIQFDGVQTALAFSTLGITGDCTVKIELNGDKWSSWVNGNQTNTNKTIVRDISIGMNLRFGLNANSDGIKVSDIKVYPI